MSEVRIEHVFKRFGDVTAVSDFDLTVKDGEFVSLLGPSGCGKTTSLRMIAGFERATEGEIYIGDHCVSSHIKNTFVPPEKRDIGMVFQSYAVWPHMTVTENVAYPLKIQKVPKEERAARVAEMLKLVHLDEYGSRYPHQLSGGMRQRAAFARTVLTGSDLLLLDEPFSALDYLTRLSMREWLLEQWEKEKKTVLFITHDVEEAVFLSSRILVVEQSPITHLRSIEVPAGYPRSREELRRPEILSLKEELIGMLKKEKA